MAEPPVNTQTATAASKKVPYGAGLRRFRYLAPTLLLLATTGCPGNHGPVAPGESSETRIAGTLPATIGQACPWPTGTWAWSWTAATAGTADSAGTASLRVVSAGKNLNWAWSFTPALPPEQPLALVPANPDRWLALRWDGSVDPGPVPLPRTAVASGHYGDLVGLLRALTLPGFGTVVTGWSGDPDGDHRAAPPIPVAIGDSVPGAVDLAACLRRAMAVWNAGAAPPWFVEAPGAAWGVRFVYFPGRDLRPPLYAQLTRLDARGRPARINIYAGDNYTDPGDSVYAVRGFVHELGHALLLWGHSDDRSHVLWGRAPPLVSAPAADERRAALLWHGLPEGVDLRNYRVVTPPATSREPSPPVGRP